MKSRTTLLVIAKALWLLVALGAAISYRACSQGELVGECQILNATLLGILTFPIGALWLGISVAIGLVLDAVGFIATLDGVWSVLPLIQLGVLICLGYLQWFVLLPWLWREWKARRSKPKPATLN